MLCDPTAERMKDTVFYTVMYFPLLHEMKGLCTAGSQRVILRVSVGYFHSNALIFITMYNVYQRLYKWPFSASTEILYVQ